MNNETEKKIPLGLKIAAAYLMLVGVTGLVLPLLNLGPVYPEFEALSTAAKTGKYFRDAAINTALLVCGAALFLP